MGKVKQKSKNYAFIDSQNLNLAIRDQDWKLDFAKFHDYLREKFKVLKSFLFIGYVSGNEALYTYLQIKKRGSSGQTKSLGMPSHRDISIITR